VPHLRTIFLSLLALACASHRYTAEYTGHVTVEQIEELRSVEVLLPIAPDSVIERYRRYDPPTFKAVYRGSIEEVAGILDSLNRTLEPRFRIDTLAIDHTLENIGAAGREGNTLYLSASYFYMFDDPAVLRSVISHEYGHILYEYLTDEEREELAGIWFDLAESALYYIFHDGEYSGNARFGGHPEDDPEELLASANNLLTNRREELAGRLRFVDPWHYPLVNRLDRLVTTVRNRVMRPLPGGDSIPPLLP
jgi:hypothetical protein